MFQAKSFRVAAIAATAIGIGVASTAPASALSFNFSFTNTDNGGGTVTGLVQGLTDNATSPATSVQVLTNTTGFGIGEYVGSPTRNSFTVSGGVIQVANFLSIGVFNPPLL